MSAAALVDHRRVHIVLVFIAEWWPKLRPTTRDWLIANNGDAVPATIVDEIADAGGPVKSNTWWVDEDGCGLVMPDDAAADQSL